MAQKRMIPTYQQAISVFCDELRRTNSAKRAFNNLSEEAQRVLSEAGFEDFDIMKDPIVIDYSKSKDDSKRAWKEYRKEVWRLTELVADQIPDIEKRGFRDHHIDHITSIWYGFKNNIPKEEIANIDNLRMLPYEENMRKGIKCGDK